MEILTIISNFGHNNQSEMLKTAPKWLHYRVINRLTNIRITMHTCTYIYGPFYRIGWNSELEIVWNLYAIFEKLSPYTCCTSSKEYIFSKRTVNLIIVFSYFFGTYFLSQNVSLPKHKISFRINIIILIYSYSCLFPHILAIFRNLFRWFPQLNALKLIF